MPHNGLGILQNNTIFVGRPPRPRVDADPLVEQTNAMILHRISSGLRQRARTRCCVVACLACLLCFFMVFIAYVASMQLTWSAVVWHLDDNDNTAVILTT